MQGDYKSADEIAVDIQGGAVLNLNKLFVDLWRRVDELQEQVNKLERQVPR